MIEVTPFGFFVIFVLTISLLIARYRTAVFVVIFFMAFETLGVINVKGGKSFCLNTPQYLTILLSLIFMMKRFRAKDTLGNEIGLPAKNLPIPVVFGLILMVASVLISFLAMNSEMIVYYRDGSITNPIKLVFTAHHITQLVYLLFSIFAFVTFFKAFRVITAKEMARVFVISTTFAALTALLSLIFRDKIAGIYDCLMNNISIGEANMFSNVISQEDRLGVWRVSGLIREPGALAQVLLCGIMILAVYIINQGVLFSKRADKLLILFLIVMTIATMSSTIIVGLCAISFALFFPMLTTKKKFSSRLVKIITFVFVISIIVVVLSYIEVLNPISMFKYTMAKLGLLKISGIGISRLYDSKLMLKSFQQSPIFGCGYGSGFLGAGGLVTLMANVGIFGTTCFLFFFREIIFVKIKKLTRRLENPDYLALFAIRMAALNILMIILATRNMGIGMYLPLWLLCAGSLGSFKIEKYQSVNNNSNLQ